MLLHPRSEMAIVMDMIILDLAFTFMPHELSMNTINVSTIIDGVAAKAD
jgi:hypothetical protein